MGAIENKAAEKQTYRSARQNAGKGPGGLEKQIQIAWMTAASSVSLMTKNNRKLPSRKQCWDLWNKRLASQTDQPVGERRTEATEVNGSA